MTEDEMVGWYHGLNGYELEQALGVGDRHGFEWTPGVTDGQGGLAGCSPWSRKELDTNE